MNFYYLENEKQNANYMSKTEESCRTQRDTLPTKPQSNLDLEINYGYALEIENLSVSDSRRKANENNDI